MRRTLMLFVGAFAAGLVLMVAATAGERFVADSSPTDENARNLTEFRDEEAGFAISYPADWQRVTVEDPQVRLLVTPDRTDSILVRVVELEAEVAEDDLPAILGLTDEIVREGESVEIRSDPTQIEVGGLPGVFYLYTFEDADTGEEGVHLHYFLFDGATMFTVVMQALPTEDFPALAPTFDAVMNTFEVPSS